ncbi:MAG TPA: xanthine dehydrogenase family protein molybdopterin-binding subunit [Xanthobacteraceae bacterium]|nr:xanthine dehydrogenase family protein molybdopterin-binding subunit [Xanthobacteraceae bacterium]
MRAAADGEGIGAAVRRVEDARYLLGRSRYVADISMPGELCCVLVRSPHAHAAIRAIDVTPALARPGVVAAFTGADMAVDAVGPMRAFWVIRSADGRPMAEPPRFALARERVRHVGEPVAAVFAETSHAALEAAESVVVDYAPLPAVTESRAALETGALQLHTNAPGNVCFRWERGDAAAVERALAGAAHVTALDLVNNRLVGAAIEPRAVLAALDPATGRLTLYDSTQTPHHVRRFLAEELRLTESGLRVIAPDVGGGFGYKGKHYPEETIVAWAARRLRRPVKWVATRAESFLADNQARDHVTRAELALDADGRFLALRVQTFANLGAYVSTFGAAIPSAIYSSLLAGPYRTPAIHVAVTGVFTNTLPTDAYRGAGRPEACYVLERLADQAARDLKIDRAEIRRRNLVPAAAIPYKTPIGPSYDSGDFPAVLERALDLADYRGFAARRRTAAPGCLRGIGIACYVESSGVAPSRFAGALGARAGFFESAVIRVRPDGGVQAMLGTHSHGQGHETTFAQIVASRLGVPLAKVEIVEGDTDRVPFGTGTFGSRSIAVGGSALDRAAAKIIAKGKAIAAHLLEAATADVEFSAGWFNVAGTDRRVDFASVAHAAHVPHDYPLETLEPGLEESAFYDPPNFAFSNGVHVAEVEVDRETGAVRVIAYRAVDDIGTVINPMIVEGQIQGGVAQGVGQALTERCAYDAAGQLLSGSFMDYALPRADDVPEVISEFDESQPCTHNPLGAKGCGEAGSIAAPAAIVNAVLDALAPLGITELDMPLTPERVWRAIRAAGRS